MTNDFEAVLSDPRVMEAVERARQQVAQEAGIAVEDVYYRLMTTDDWTTIPGNATPGPEAYPIAFAANINTFMLKSVGDRFQKAVFVGFLIDGLWGLIDSAQLLLNGNRVGEWTGAIFWDTTSAFVVLPDGPKIIDAKCSMSFVLNMAGAMAPLSGYDFPIVIVFPLCG